MEHDTEEKTALGVEVKDLCKSFGDQLVLDGINLTIHPGEVFVIMGPSGSGKSVLLKHLVGLEKPTSGEVFIDGKSVRDPATLQEVHAALVFQAGALFNSMSVYDNLALYPREHRLYDRATIDAKVKEALRMLSLENAIFKHPSELSGGMKKRVAIARALVMEPQLLLYDEPTSELDPVMSANISEIIAVLRRETKVTSIVVSHDRDLSLAIADRIAILMHGRIKVVATPGELRRNQDEEILEFLNPVINPDQPRFKANPNAL